MNARILNQHNKCSININQFKNTKYALFDSKLIPNIIFLMFLQDCINKQNQNSSNCQNNYKKLKNTINKKNKTNIEEQEKQIEQQLISLNTLTPLEKPKNYGDLINFFKEKYKTQFQKWLCELNRFFEDHLQEVQSFIAKSGNQNADLNKLLDLLNKRANQLNTFGDYLDYYLIFGYYLTVLRIKGKQMIGQSDEYIKYYKLQQSVIPYVLPIVRNITKMKKIIDDKTSDCYASVLNDVFYFMDLIGNNKNLGGKLSIYDYFARIGNKYEVEEIKETSNEKSLSLFERIFGKKKEGKKYAIYVNSDGSSSAMIPPTSPYRRGEVIFVAIAQDKNILVKVVTKEMKKNNVTVSNQPDVISIQYNTSTKSVGNKGIITIICLGGKEDIVLLEKNSTGYSIKLNGELKYKLINNGLIRTTDPLVQPVRVKFDKKSFTTSDITPSEFTISAIIMLMILQNIL